MLLGRRLLRCGSSGEHFLGGDEESVQGGVSAWMEAGQLEAGWVVLLGGVAGHATTQVVILCATQVSAGC